MVTPATLRLSQSRSNPLPDSPPRNPGGPGRVEPGGRGQSVRGMKVTTSHSTTERSTPTTGVALKCASYGMMGSVVGTNPNPNVQQSRSLEVISAIFAWDPTRRRAVRSPSDQGRPPSGGSQTLVERSNLALLNRINTYHLASEDLLSRNSPRAGRSQGPLKPMRSLLN